MNHLMKDCQVYWSSWEKQEKVALLLVFFGCLLKQILSILHFLSRKKDV